MSSGPVVTNSTLSPSMATEATIRSRASNENRCRSCVAIAVIDTTPSSPVRSSERTSVQSYNETSYPPLPLSGNRVQSPPVSPTSAGSTSRNWSVVVVVEEDAVTVVVEEGAVVAVVEEDVVAAVVPEQAETTSINPTHQAHDFA